MTKEMIKEALKKDYMDALSTFANYIASFDEEDQEDEIYDLDGVAYEVAEKIGEEENWLIIFSALLTAI